MAINLDDNLNINAAKPTRTTDLVGTGQLYATKEDIPAYLLFEGLTTYDIDNSAAWIYQGSAWVDNEVNLGNYSFDNEFFYGLNQTLMSAYEGELVINEEETVNVSIYGNNIQLPTLSNANINAGGDQYATTKGWVNSKFGNYSFEGDNLESKGDVIIQRTQTVPESVDKIEYKLFQSNLTYQLFDGVTKLTSTYDDGNSAFLVMTSPFENAQLSFGTDYLGGTRYIHFFEDEIRIQYTIAEIDAADNYSAVTKEWVNAYKASLYATKKTEAGTSYTIQASDLGKNIHFTAATTITVTLPNGLATGFKCNLIKAAAGNVVITAATTLHSNGNSLKSLYTMAEVIHEGSNVWSAYGGKLTV